MTSMELDDEAKMDAAQPIAMLDKPDYPYGLRICLCGDELEKLNLDPSDAFIGGIIHGHFLATITSLSMSAGENYSDCRVELQITHLNVLSEDEENEEDGGY
jgi:hypothetical protein